MDMETWLATEYKEIWHKAYDAGVQARLDNKPRTCDLYMSPFAYSSEIGEKEGTPMRILKPYKSAWEQGWDGRIFPN